MNKLIGLLLAIVVSSILFSCQEPTVPVQDAVKMTKEQLKSTIGYEWFNGYWNLYKPDTNVTKDIATTFDPNVHKFVLFIEASCSCKELVKEPAEVVRVLDDAKVNSDYYEIYTMGSTQSKHPYEDKIKIKSLPQVWLVKSGEFSYSILDTFSYYKNRQFKKIEVITLEALQR